MMRSLCLAMLLKFSLKQPGGYEHARRSLLVGLSLKDGKGEAGKMIKARQEFFSLLAECHDF